MEAQKEEKRVTLENPLETPSIHSCRPLPGVCLYSSYWLLNQETQRCHSAQIYYFNTSESTLCANATDMNWFQSKNL